MGWTKKQLGERLAAEQVDALALAIDKVGRDVEIRYQAKVNFTPPSWPVITTSGRGRVERGGNQVVIKPASWVGRHMIFMFVEQDGMIKLMGTEEDYLVCNVSYNGPHLPNPIRASALITAFEPIEFSYPLSPTGDLGEAKFSAFGVVGGKLWRSAEQTINFDEEAVFILATEDDIKLVSQASVFPESDNSLAARLKRAGARPIIAGNMPEGVRSERQQRYPETVPLPNGDELRGTIVGVEYAAAGPSLLVETYANGVQRVPLRNHELADRFDDERKRVRVHLDAQSYADAITVEL